MQTDYKYSDVRSKTIEGRIMDFEYSLGGRWYIIRMRRGTARAFAKRNSSFNLSSTIGTDYKLTIDAESNIISHNKIYIENSELGI